NLTIELLTKLGYQHLYGPDIAPDGISPKRESFEDVLLIEHLRKAATRINPTILQDSIEDAIREIQRLNSPELIANNEAFHRMLTEGIKVTYQKDREERGDLVWLIDFKNPENNDFVVVNQFTVVENGVSKRPDVDHFLNGLPLVIIELKNPADENATVKSAYKQLETYKQSIPSLFTYNEILVISDGLEAKAGSLSAGFDRFMAWKSSDGKVEALHLTSQLETLIKGILNKISSSKISGTGISDISSSSFSFIFCICFNVMAFITISKIPPPRYKVYNLYEKFYKNKHILVVHYTSYLLFIISFAINSACFNTVSVASFCISGG
ncbi:type I restriction endonuclease, partial [Peptococcaceae bacterium]|nr:type I restriction endonuclease [Peptococcaceae bacterium]